jgi:HD-like signal output (HDOD) protein/DNA-binding NarL/FixJ family response regulator
MSTVLVVDDMAVFREPIAASLRLAGYETLCAGDGVEALEMARERRPDVILLDVSMPKMDGISFLKHLRGDSAIAGTRVILLTALTEKKYVLAAGALGVRDYLLKSRFKLKDLLDRIRKPNVSAEANRGSNDSPSSSSAAAAAAAAAAVVVAHNPTASAPALPVTNVRVSAVLTPDRFQEKIEGALQAKAMSGVITQVISLANSPRGDTVQLANLISRDGVLSARVLQAANSAAYSSSGSVVTTVADAIRKIGCAKVRNIAAAVGVFDCMPEASADGFNPMWCWQHSFAVAQLCERLAAAKAPESAGLAYVVGLCHDLGEIFIRTLFAKEIQMVVDATAQTGRPLAEIHREMLGMSHAQMIRSIFKCMGLPAAIREPIELLHSPSGPKSDHPLARILWTAENYANGAMLASGPGSEVAPLAQSFGRVAVADQNPTRPDPEVLRSEVLATTVTLAGLSRSDQAKLLVPMFKVSEAKVWVARHAGISEFDPIGIALESMAKAEVHPRLPTPDDVKNVDGVVIVAPSPDTPGFTATEITAALRQHQRSEGLLPLLAIACEPQRGDLISPIAWRSVMSLSQLAGFIESLAVAPG